MLTLIVSLLVLSGLVFLLLDLVRYDVEEMWMPINWVTTLLILPFVITTNLVLFVWYLLEDRNLGFAYDQTFRGMGSDIWDALTAGW